MKKPKGRKKTPKRKQPQEKKPQKPIARESENKKSRAHRLATGVFFSWKIVWSIVGVVATLCSILGAYFVLPKIDVESTGSLNPKLPLSTRFCIENQSIFAIRDVRVETWWKNGSKDGFKVLLPFGSSIESGKTNQILGRPDVVYEVSTNRIEELPGNSKQDVNCGTTPDIIPVPPSIQMALTISYKPILQSRKSETYFFWAKPDTEGKFQWFRAGKSKTPVDMLAEMRRLAPLDESKN